MAGLWDGSCGGWRAYHSHTPSDGHVCASDPVTWRSKMPLRAAACGFLESEDVLVYRNHLENP